MTAACGIAVKGLNLRALFVDSRTGPKIVFEIFPIVAALVIGSQCPAGVIAAMYHAVLAPSIARDTVHNAILVPVHLVQHFLVVGVMAVGHQVTRRFPAFDIAGWDR